MWAGSSISKPLRALKVKLDMLAFANAQDNLPLWNTENDFFHHSWKPLFESLKRQNVQKMSKLERLWRNLFLRMLSWDECWWYVRESEQIFVTYEERVTGNTTQMSTLGFRHSNITLIIQHSIVTVTRGPCSVCTRGWVFRCFCVAIAERHWKKTQTHSDASSLARSLV